MSKTVTQSIVIPSYNRGSLLKRAIESVMQQTHFDWELIIVDDGSEDGTEEVVESFLQDRRISFIKKNNTGAGDSRNVGAEAAIGEYLVFLDSDDEMKPDLLKKFADEIENDDTGIVCCGFEQWQENKLITSKMPSDLGPVFSNITGSFVAGSFMIRKECFRRVGGYDIDLASGQHTELFMRLVPFCMEHNFLSKHISEALLKIHLHTGERIRTNHRAIYQGTKGILDKHFSLLNRSKEDLFNYYNIAAYHANAIGEKKEAYSYYRKAFLMAPALKPLLKLIRTKF
ncbi:hypothetical protein C7S20_17450 [Christiangramia fulva]|uniref:Glycosyltransferase 2-like domain-containing protein n=1 Tax=Christiangramia fulva TaxID=2126553 RepID=A0A2R3Z9E1_9FLAO|nr:glycosyltransferase family A protein [Christiangramia fulva]AVR46903.1 hypothetical protein C7S20_17450 [Christiangramia fulva]